MSRHTNSEDFSFCKRKAAFEYLLLGSDNSTYLVEDKKDFWNFINKYEVVLRKTTKTQESLPATQLHQFLPFHKRKLIGLQMTTRQSESLKNEAAQKEQEFRDMILLYLDFKQKEKFAKIKTLRKNQNQLPIARFKLQIQQALQETRVLIVAGDTGCGKSTQVPQYLYNFGYRKIACTQPRRLACVSLSQRVAHEMMQSYTSKVGFQIRFESRKNSHTNIIFITEGLLLRQLVNEEQLEQYEVLILDEIHERNLFGDFLLGVTKCLLLAKPNIKVILMSATINLKLFEDYFANMNARSISLPGRLFPIKTLYLPPPAVENSKGSHRSKTRTESARLNPAPYIDVLKLIDHKYPITERGDVLIFVSGVNEILSICDAAKEYGEQVSHWIILPLHSGLSLADQDKVFDYAPDGMRKCIVSTNIAETSLTVDGIRFVIDSGKVKEMSYDAACKGQRLKEFWVSKASAEQRKGRAGRTGPGTCYRLFSQKQFDLFEAYSTPEIFRVPLDNILLQMVAMGLHNVRMFPFIEKPDDESIEQTILSLKQHNALADDESITPLGRTLSNLPVEMSIAKMLLMGSVFTNIEQILTVAAIMSVQNPFTQRAYRDAECETARETIKSEHGDIFTLLNAFCEWLDLKMQRENSNKWCHKLGIEEQRFYEITKLRCQFHNILNQCNFIPKTVEATLSKAERTRRHGEIRMLKAIKRKQQFQEPRQRKVLKSQLDSMDANKDGRNPHTREDVRDVEFRLTFDSARIELLHNSAQVHQGDLIMVKMIICSGLYPQIAIADEFNYCKGGSQQFFHTRLKPFVALYPNEYFAQHYDQLKLSDSDIISKPHYYTPRQPLSERHQLLCFQNLMETTKPYIMNCMPMAAAQTLLLFSHTIDTNIAISQVVCDSWLSVDFPIPETGCKLLCKAIKLRTLWRKLLNQKLNASQNEDENEAVETEHKLASELRESLINYMRTNISYTIKRLLPADVKSIYNRQNSTEFKFKLNPFAVDFPITKNTEKGGLNVAPNVVYGCLQEVEWTVQMNSIIAEDIWQCSKCSFSTPMNTITKLMHKKLCLKEDISKREKQNKPEEIAETKISQIDILRQRKRST